MQYIDYQEYLRIGGICDTAVFNRNIDRVCGIIDRATFGRIEDMAKVPASAKALCRDLIDYMAKNTATDTVVTSKSQSAGGVSESESYLVKTKEEQAQDIDNMIIDYLICVKDDKGTPLLYRGCRT